MSALLSDQFVDHLRNKPFEAFGAVVGGDMEVFGHGAHRVGVNEHVAGLGADDHVGLDAVFLEPFDLRIDRGGAYAACDEEVMPLAEFVERQGAQVNGPDLSYSVFAGRNGKRAVVVVNMGTERASKAEVTLPGASAMAYASPEDPAQKTFGGSVEIAPQSAVVIFEK